MGTKTAVTKGIGWTLALIVPAWSLLLLAYLAERSFGGRWIQFCAALILGGLLIGARRIWSSVLLTYADQQQVVVEPSSTPLPEETSSSQSPSETVTPPETTQALPPIETKQPQEKPLRALWKAEWLMWLCGMVVGMFCFCLVFFGFFHPLNQLAVPWRALVLIATLNVSLTLGYLLGFIWQRRQLDRS